ncbi:TraR/DksA family transcriptional regulator [Roseovarius rhodophyticola]|uniref:TraR/DksA C4-type zinc finger protein n=1 Tax=Roseovarius rhodophyticola TaxID=3080827 RepID=A0ABZ2TE87_9RHOB|nr:TraR/DksA C4-type zinc finger protein [Roseovarius sp. W115]MDV2928275.1 TraR/DksA C4-type zinc finger protein [Roseovarius sp. W115]
MADLKYFKIAIETRLKELGVRLHQIEDELDAPKPQDLSDQAIDLEDDEVLEGIGLVEQQEVGLLQQALKRIREGDYGTCAMCEQPISTERLKAVLYASVCKDCANQSKTG